MAEITATIDAPAPSATKPAEGYKPVAKEVQKKETTSLPSCAKEGEIYNARHGRGRKFMSFETELALRLDNGEKKETSDATPKAEEQAEQAKQIFTFVATELSPQMQEIIKELKQLGIENDLLLPNEFRLLSYAIKTDQWGERPRADFPQTPDAYNDDPLNPLNTVTIDQGIVTVSPLHSELDIKHIQSLMQKLYGTIVAGGVHVPKLDNAELQRWIETQAVSRSILEAKGELKPTELTLENATFVKALKSGEDIKQASNPIEIWQTPDNRRLVVKRGPIHTLQAEILENRAMAMMGIPVPDTSLQIFNGEPVLIVGFLEKYYEEKNPFELSEYYHTNRVLQNGLIVDLWMDQYNRRPHNVMMKDGKIAFIDHGGAAFCRATGGFKEFSDAITTENIWDVIRTIPDDNPNGDVPVNEAYAQILDVTGGSQGETIAKDPFFLQGEITRLSRFTNEQIADIVAQAGYTDGPESIQQMRAWLRSDDIAGRLARLRTKPEAERTKKDNRDIRWTEGAIKTLEAAIQAGGMQTYMTRVLTARRDNLVTLLTGVVEKTLAQATSPSKPSELAREATLPQQQFSEKIAA